MYMLLTIVYLVGENTVGWLRMYIYIYMYIDVSCLAKYHIRW